MDMSSMSMSMTTTSSMPSATSSSGMGMSDTTMMDMSMMQMTFFQAQNTSLWTMQFTPNSAGSYAGTCIFLIILAVVFRGLFAFKHYAEHYWRSKALNRRYVTVAGKGSDAESMRTDSEAKNAVISVNGVEEGVRIVERPLSPVQPFRLSVDPLRALLMTTIATVGYLLMLAVMTMNVGYFLSVLGGVFLGELALGRIAQGSDNM
ncbi:MAG: hypothetical protein M1821_003147 [Bathelium mastoideum]|nr:MAG: hypothetical protein M1821_003147 [Bathelium mastoideum]KAI9688175.1 MAG: hypothetical protein M1822_001681 [Bathelium mastoideum]